MKFTLKLLFKIFIFFFLGLFFTLIGTDVAFAEMIADQKVDEVINTDTPKPKEETAFDKTVKWIWSYKYHILFGFVICGLTLVILTSGGTASTPETIPPIQEGSLKLPAPGIDVPHVRSQTIEELVTLDPRFTTSTEASANFPDVIELTPKRIAYYEPAADVMDIRFPVAILDKNGVAYQIFRVGETTPYDTLTADYYIKVAASANGVTVGNVLDNHYQLMYSKVALLPVDGLYYNVYHKVDIVSVVVDSQAPNNLGVELPVRGSILFKDN